MKQKAYSSRIKKTVGLLTNVSEANLAAAVGGEAFGTGGTVVRRGRGRPTGSVQYRDDYGNPIGVYEWRKLQRMKERQIRLKTAMAQAAAAQAMAAASARQEGNIPQGMTPEQQLMANVPGDSGMDMQDMQMPQDMPQEAPQMPSRPQMTAQKAQYLRQLQAMKAQGMQVPDMQMPNMIQQGPGDQPHAYRAPQDAQANPWGLKARYKMNFSDNNIARADARGNILNTPDVIMSAPNMFASQKTFAPQNAQEVLIQEQRLRDMEDFNIQKSRSKFTGEDGTPSGVV